MDKNNVPVNNTRQTTDQTKAYIRELNLDSEYDMLDMGNVPELIMANERAKIRKKHGYAITPP